MREIKFRAWYVTDGRMITISDKGGYAKVKSLSELFRMAEINTYELMQFTGLKDKNGREIYEGDIVKNYHQNYVIKWNGGNAQFMPFTTMPVDEGNHIASAGVPIRDWNWVSTPLGDWRSVPREEIQYGHGINFHGNNQKVEACEVIGNIYQNKDLL